MDVDNACHDASLIKQVLFRCGYDRDEVFRLSEMYEWARSDVHRYNRVCDALRDDYWNDDSHALDDLEKEFDEFERGLPLTEVPGTRRYNMGCGYAEYECPNGERISHDWDDLWASNDSVWKFENDKCRACCDHVSGSVLRQLHPCWKGASNGEVI